MNYFAKSLGFASNPDVVVHFLVQMNIMLGAKLALKINVLSSILANPYTEWSTLKQGEDLYFFTPMG